MGDQGAYIVIQGPGHSDTRIALREGITSFGRLPSNDVILLGDLVSRHHARIIYFDGKASLQDLGSHNGSWVNNDRVTTRALTTGDVMRIGNFRVEFTKGEDSAEREDFTSEATRDEVDHTVPPPAPPMLRTAESSENTERRVSPKFDDPAEEEKLTARPPGRSPIVRQLGAAAGGDPGAGSVLSLLYRLTEALSVAEAPEDYSQRVLSVAVERVPAQAAILFRVGDPTAEPFRMGQLGPAVERGDAKVSMSVVRWAIDKNFTVYSKNVAQDLRFRQGTSVAGLTEDQVSLVCSPLSTADRVIGALYLARSADQPFTEQDVDVVEAVCHLAAVGITRIESWRVSLDQALERRLLGRLHSTDVIDRILRSTEPRPFLEAHEGAVCFAGIQGFSSVAEQLPPEEISTFLGAYLDAMTARIFAHRGTFHQLLGDEFVAVFGSPFTFGNDVMRAVAAALELRNRYDRLIAEHSGLGSTRLSVGVACGPILAGAVGPGHPLEYTVLGEPVRVAARIRALAPPGTVLVSGSALALVNDRFEARLAGRKQLRARHDAEDVFEVTGLRAPTQRTSADQ